MKNCLLTRSVRFVAAFLLLGALFAASCGGGIVYKKFSYAEKVKRVKALVIVQPDLAFRGMQAHQVFERWMDFMHKLSRETDLILIGPDEYRVLTSGVVTDLIHETDLATQLKKYGVSPQETVAVKVMLLESWQQVQSVVSNRDKSRRGISEYDSEIEFSADAYLVSNSKPLFSIAHRVSETLFALPGECDPRPEITTFADEHYALLIDKLVDELGARKIDPGKTQWPVTALETPREALDYRYQALTPLKISLEEMDEMDKDVVLNGRVCYRHPNLDRGASRALLRMNDGLYVQKAETCSGLESGDWLLKAGGADVKRTYQVLRAVRGFATTGTALEFEVKRKGNVRTVTYSCK